MTSLEAAPQGAPARPAAARRIRCLSAAVVLAAGVNIGSSQGALAPSSEALPHYLSLPHHLVWQPLSGSRITAESARNEQDARIAAKALQGGKALQGEKALEVGKAEEAARAQEALNAVEAQKAPPDPQAIISGFAASAQELWPQMGVRTVVSRIRRDVREAEAIAGHPDDILEFERMRVARWIVDAVLLASVRTGVDAVYMMALADKESSLIPDNAARTSSAEGLFQFVEQTWLETLQAYGAEHGFKEEAEAIETNVKNGKRSVKDEKTRERILNLRRDPLVAGLMAGEMMNRDRARIEAELEREISWHEMYMAHFLGAGGALRLLRLAEENPKAKASKALPAAAKANRTIFYAKKGRGAALSVAEVYKQIETMIVPRMERYAAIDDEPARLPRTRTIASLRGG